MDNNEFRKQIDELFRLFNKLMERYPMEDMPGMNRMQLEQMKMFLKNYEQMKDQISFEMMGQVNEPMRQMIGLFIKQLRDELGEEEPLQEEQPQIVATGLSIEEIDARLSMGGLSEEEIDRLLDERAKLQQNGK
ncbi:MAG: hypothetical protein LWX09_12205 [Bacteroidia bacterium]|jgi:hypothetical protein|nr:hypothetical protein [Bacteroidia bacterium]